MLKNHKKLLNGLSWVFGILFCIAGLGGIGDPLVGIPFLAMGLVILPPFLQWLSSKHKVEVKPLHKAIVLFVGFIMIGSSGEVQQDTIYETPISVETEEEEEPVAEVQPVEPVVIELIDYQVLRSWNPDEDPAGVGLEILIAEADATKQSIVDLIESLSDDTDKALIKVYQSRSAWNEEKSGTYSDVYKTDYLAFYAKNKTDNGTYKGSNYIIWMQELGPLEYLYGDKTNIYN